MTSAPKAVNVSMRTAVWMVLMQLFLMATGIDKADNTHVEASSDAGTLEGLRRSVLMMDELVLV